MSDNTSCPGCGAMHDKVSDLNRYIQGREQEIERLRAAGGQQGADLIAAQYALIEKMRITQAAILSEVQEMEAKADIHEEDARWLLGRIKELLNR